MQTNRVNSDLHDTSVTPSQAQTHEPSKKAPAQIEQSATLLFNWAGNCVILPPIPLQATVLTQKALPPAKVLPTAFNTIRSGVQTGGSPSLLRFYDAIKPEFVRLGARTVVKSGFQVEGGGFDQIAKRVPAQYAPAAKAATYALVEAALVGPFDYLRTCRSIGQAFNWNSALKGSGANSVRQFLVWDVYFETRNRMLPTLSKAGMRESLQRDLVVGAGTGAAISLTAGPMDTAMRMIQLQSDQSLANKGIPKPRSIHQVTSDLMNDRLSLIKTANRSTYLNLFKHVLKHPWPMVLGTVAKSPAIVGLATLTEVVQSGTLKKSVDSLYNRSSGSMR